MLHQATSLRAVRLFLSAGALCISHAEAKPPASSLRNVILLIPDGTGTAAITLARWANGGAPLAMDELACGLVRTYAADAPVTDSAPAATAMSTGFKSHAGYIGTLPAENTLWGQGLLPQNSDGTPVATVLEAARLSGRAVGLVATSQISHATPAAFAAHSRNRNAMDNLTEQLVHAQLDVALAGGADFLSAEKRADKEDLVEALKTQGYAVATDAESFRVLDSSRVKKIWGVFAAQDLAYDLDRDPAKEPALEELTTKAIEVLNQNRKGFFLMVEGSKVDWAAHANDPVGVVSEVLAFDRAVRIALDFAKRRKDTAVIIAPDHNTGAMAINNQRAAFEVEPLSTYLGPIKRARHTATFAAARIAAERSRAKEILAETMGLQDITDAEAAVLLKTDSITSTIGAFFSIRANIGWGTLGHSGEDVPLFAWHPKGDRPSGVIQNTDIAHYIARQLGLDLGATSARLFTEISTGATQAGATWEWDKGDEKNPVLSLSFQGRRLRLPVNKNLADLDGSPVILPGVVVADGNRAWIPRAAIEALVKKKK